MIGFLDLADEEFDEKPFVAMENKCNLNMWGSSAIRKLHRRFRRNDAIAELRLCRRTPPRNRGVTNLHNAAVTFYVTV